MPECQHISFTNNDVVVAMQELPNHPKWLPGFSGPSAPPTVGPKGCGEDFESSVQCCLTKPREMPWGKELRAIWCIAMRVINRSTVGILYGIEVWKRGTAPVGTSLGRNKCASASETVTLGKQWDWSTIIYIYIYLCVSLRRIGKVLVFTWQMRQLSPSALSVAMKREMNSESHGKRNYSCLQQRWCSLDIW